MNTAPDGFTPAQIAQAKQAQALMAQQAQFGVPGPGSYTGAGVPGASGPPGPNAGDLTQAPPIDVSSLVSPRRVDPPVPGVDPSTVVSVTSPSGGSPSAPAAPAAPGAPAGANPNDAILARYLGGSPGQGQHAQGLSPADRAQSNNLTDLRNQRLDDSSLALQTIADSAKGFAAHADALAADSKTGLLDFQKSQAADAELRQRIADEQKENQLRINAKLAEAEAQGVDPNQWFSRQSTGTNILGALAVGLGQFGAQLGHSQNAALEIIHSAVQNDIDAQKTNLESHVKLIKDELGANAGSFNERLALLNAQTESTQTAYSVVQRQIAQQLGIYRDSADFQRSGQQLIDGVNSQRDAQLLQFSNEKYNILKQGERLTGGGVPAAGNGQKVAELAGKIKEENAQRGVNVSLDDSRHMAENRLAGTSYEEPNEAKPLGREARTPEDKKSASALASLRVAADQIGQLIKMRHDNNGGSYDPKDKSAAAALSTSARSSLEAGLGARIGEANTRMYSSLIPEDPLEHNAWSSFPGQGDPSLARLQQAQATALSHIDAIQKEGDETPTAAPGARPPGAVADK